MNVLERVGLADKGKRMPNQLSGGEQGRLAIARALVNDPPLLLADEPTGALDTRTGQEVMDVFLDLNRQGQTIFMVTHNPANAAQVHRTLHIRDGRLIPELPGLGSPVDDGDGSGGPSAVPTRDGRFSHSSGS